MPGTLTKAVIISTIQTKNDYPYKKSTLQSGGDVMISGFGKFQLREKKRDGDETLLPVMI